jgi:hypothetical protein
MNSSADVGRFNLERFEHFHLSEKSAYRTMQDLIISENNKLIVFDEHNIIVANYLTVKNGIDMGRYKHPNDFLDDMLRAMLPPWFIAKVRTYVLDEIHKDTLKRGITNPAFTANTYNPSLIIDDTHIEIVGQAAAFIRLTIPLLTHFIHKYKDMFEGQKGGRAPIKFVSSTGEVQIFNKTDFLTKSIEKILETIERFNGNEVTIYGKIHHYVKSMIRRTLSADYSIWLKNATVNRTPALVTKMIVCKLLTEVIPKSHFGRTIATFITNSIENQKKWVRRYRFGANISFISNVSDDANDLSDADKFDINSAKSDELKRIIAKTFMDDTISTILTRRNYTLNMDEYQFYLTSCEIHSTQDFMVRTFFSMPFGGWGNLDGLNKQQYIKLLTYLTWFLRMGNKFTILPDILVGNKVSINEKRVVPKNLEKRIRNSDSYQAIMRRYTYTEQKIKSEFIIETPLTVMLNTRFVYNTYGNKKNGTPIEYEDSAILCEEYLRFMAMLT